MTTPDTNINGYLKQYHLVKELKQSAWEETYLVEDPEDSGLYVLTRLNKNKIISRLLDDIGGLKDPCETEDEALEEFKKNDKDFKKCLEGALEIPAHPNVARVISVDHDQFKEQHFAIIEYVEGKPIKDETKGLSTIRKLQLIIQTFEGLSHLHEYETLHLRIKPDNIFVFRDGKRFRAKFINPGYAVHRDNWNHIKSVGPKYWVAPEVVFEKGADEKSDLYMMAALSYYLLSGKKPYPKRKAAENDVKKLREIIKRDEVKGKERPPSLINLVPDVTPALDKLILSLLEPDPQERRFPTATAVIAEILREYPQLADNGFTGQEKITVSTTQRSRQVERSTTEDLLVDDIIHDEMDEPCICINSISELFDDKKEK